MLLGDTGSGKTSAAFIIFKELFHLCTRWHIISSTIEHDGSFEEMKDMIYEGLRQQGIDADEDPQEKFCHESLDALAGIVQQARRRTHLAKEADQKFLPQAFLYIDDIISFMRHSSMLDRLMATSRHIGLNIVLNSQQYVGLSTLQRKSLSCIGLFKVHARELDGGHFGAGGQEQRLGGRFTRSLQDRDGEATRLSLDTPPGQGSERDAVLGVYETNSLRLSVSSRQRLKDFAA